MHGEDTFGKMSALAPTPPVGLSMKQVGGAHLFGNESLLVAYYYYHILRANQTGTLRKQFSRCFDF